MKEWHSQFLFSEIDTYDVDDDGGEGDANDEK